MVRNSIRKSKENYSSINELKKVTSPGYSGLQPASTQNTPNNFDMMNTLMVLFIYKINLINQKLNLIKSKIQMLMIQQQISEMTQKNLISQHSAILTNQKSI